MTLKQISKKYDLIGMLSAFICMIHCIIFPLLIFIPIGISHNPFIDLIFLSIGIWSVYKTTKSSSSLFVKYLLWLSIVFVSYSITIHIIYYTHSSVMYIGAFGLIMGHIINFNHHKNSINDK